MKWIKKTIYWSAYWAGLDALFYFLNRRAKRIVCFHSVLPCGMKLPGLACGLDNTEEEFREIVREIRLKFPISNDVHDPKTATLTFDDGFLNQYEVAGRILKEEGDVPAILFVAGDMAGCRDPENCLVVEKLLAWTTYAKVNAEKNRMGVWKDVRAAFVTDVDGKGKRAVETCNAIEPMKDVLERLPAEYRRLRMTGVNNEQIDELKRRGWVVGWHSKSHFPLAALSEDEQRRELEAPACISRGVLAYPYGDDKNVSCATIRIAKELGYASAVSFMTDPGPMAGSRFLPRMFLRPDKYALHAELSGFLHFLRTHKRLPAEPLHAI